MHPQKKKNDNASVNGRGCCKKIYKKNACQWKGLLGVGGIKGIAKLDSQKEMAFGGKNLMNS